MNWYQVMLNDDGVLLMQQSGIYCFVRGKNYQTTSDIEAHKLYNVEFGCDIGIEYFTITRF